MPTAIPAGLCLLGCLAGALPDGTLQGASVDREHVLFVGMNVLVAISGKPPPVVQADSHDEGKVEVTLAPRASGDTGDDAALLAALRSAQFLPAVVKGKAAAGAGTFALAELVPGSGSE